MSIVGHISGVVPRIVGRSIDVNRNDLVLAAHKIDAFCEMLNAEMGTADAAVTTMLLSFWSGRDADEFRQKWAMISESSSSSKQMYESLRNYAIALRACAKIYKEVQTNVHNFAGNRLRNAGR